MEKVNECSSKNGFKKKKVTTADCFVPRNNEKQNQLNKLPAALRSVPQDNYGGK